MKIEIRPLLLALVLATALAAPAPVIAKSETAASKKTTDKEALIQLDFQNVEIAKVIRAISEMTGYNFIFDDRVRGKISIISPQAMTRSEVLSIFFAALNLKGYTFVQNKNTITVIPLKDIKSHAIPTDVDGNYQQ